MPLHAQHTISGTFSPAKDYKWLIAYRLKPGTQTYVADTAVKNGVFSLKIPENSFPGTYRLVYAVPQEQFYFDVIYNGKEDITLTFDATNGVSFFTSKENILFNTYFKKITDLEQQLTNYYTGGSTNKKEFKALAEQLQSTQDTYEKRTEGTMAHNFIKNNRPYVPTETESVATYVNKKKAHYFDALDFDNPILQASGFLTDKMINYVFTALPLKPMSDTEKQKVMNHNVDTINKKLETVDDIYKMHLFYSLWTQASASTLNLTADYINDTYLKKLASTTNNKDIIDQIEVHNRLRVGALAPEIKWRKDDVPRTLSGLKESENYVLAFWSSTCGHCLKELPKLHKELEGISTVKVIAVGLENDDTTWKKESAHLPLFEHAIALGKWQSAYAKTYNIHKTPTYFVLDKDKKIIAKPDNDKEIVEFLENE